MEDTLVEGRPGAGQQAGARAVRPAPRRHRRVQGPRRLAAGAEPARSPAPSQAAVDALTFVGLLPAGLRRAPDQAGHRPAGRPRRVLRRTAGRSRSTACAIDEPYLAPGVGAQRACAFDVIVPEGGLWVMGDNRQHSPDSRYNRASRAAGSVPIDNVVGVAFVTVWPLDRVRPCCATRPRRSRRCPTAVTRVAGRTAVPVARPAPAPRARAAARRARALVAGMDEVGRGALAGPVSVGVVVVDARHAVRARGRRRLQAAHARGARRAAARARPLGRWRAPSGTPAPQEIDELGIIAALRLAGHACAGAARARVGPVDVVLLDGSHDWLQPAAQPDLFDALDDGRRIAGGRPAPRRAHAGQGRPHVRVGRRGERAGQVRAGRADGRARRAATPRTAGTRTRGTARPSTSRRCASSVRARCTGARWRLPGARRGAPRDGRAAVADVADGPLTRGSPRRSRGARAAGRWGMMVA